MVQPIIGLYKEGRNQVPLRILRSESSRIMWKRIYVNVMNARMLKTGPTRDVRKNGHVAKRTSVESESPSVTAHCLQNRKMSCWRGRRSNGAPGVYGPPRNPIRAVIGHIWPVVSR